MNIQYEFWKLIAAIKQSEPVQALRNFYREEPTPCTLILAGAMFVIGIMSWGFFLVIYAIWPDSLYIFLSGAAIVAVARWILNWISRG